MEGDVRTVALYLQGEAVGELRLRLWPRKRSRYMDSWGRHKRHKRFSGLGGSVQQLACPGSRYFDGGANGGEHEPRIELSSRNPVECCHRIALECRRVLPHAYRRGEPAEHIDFPSDRPGC